MITIIKTNAKTLENMNVIHLNIIIKMCNK